MELIRDVMADSGASRGIVVKELLALKMLQPKPDEPRPPFSPRISTDSQRYVVPKPPTSRPASARPASARTSFMAPRPPSAPLTPRAGAARPKPPQQKRPQSARLPEPTRWNTSNELQYPNWSKTHKHLYLPTNMTPEELAELTALKKSVFEREQRAHLKMTPEELSNELQARTNHSDIFHTKPVPKWMASNACDIVRPVDESRFASNNRRPGDMRAPWQYC